MEQELELTLKEKIDRAIENEGRTQTWIVKKLNEKLPADDKITEVRFSMKKSDKEKFTETELKLLSKLLKTKFD